MRMKLIMPVLIFVTALVFALAAGSARSAEPDAALIAKITGLEPAVKNGVAKVSVPRSDLSVVIDGVGMQPFQGLTSWAAFQQAGDQTIVMGDLVLTQDRVNPAMSAALDNGLEVTALHNHFFYDRPNIFFMHIGGMGGTEQLATGVRRALDAAKAVGATGPAGTNRGKDAACGEPSLGFGGPTIPAQSSIDPKPLEEILGASGQAKDGMVKFVLERKTSMHGVEVGEAMGINTWAVFRGSPEVAVVDGDFAMLEGELQEVLKALRRAGINVVAIHNHMIGEQPRIVFLHFWGKGKTTDLAAAIKTAVATQGR